MEGVSLMNIPVTNMLMLNQLIMTNLPNNWSENEHFETINVEKEKEISKIYQQISNKKQKERICRINCKSRKSY